jgi:transcriptional regulator with XRE-family HTH domain
VGDARADIEGGGSPGAAGVSRSFNTNVGEAIRRARRARRWTQAALAKRAGVSANYIARLERGELGPSLFVASRICAALTISIDVLVAPANAAKETSPAPRRTSVG